LHEELLGVFQKWAPTQETTLHQGTHQTAASHSKDRQLQKETYHDTLATMVAKNFKLNKIFEAKWALILLTSRKHITFFLS
jgi:hypothetical protein